MPSWPRETRYSKQISLSNVTEWVRRTGRLPAYANAAGGGPANTPLTPIRIRAPFLAKRLWVLNGTTPIVSPVAMFLAAGGTSLGYGFVPEQVIASSVMALQGAANTVQYFDIPDTLLAPGDVWVGITQNTGDYTTLFTPIAGFSGEQITWNCFFTVISPTYDSNTPFNDLLTMAIPSNGIVPIMGISGAAA